VLGPRFLVSAVRSAAWVAILCALLPSQRAAAASSNTLPVLTSIRAVHHLTTAEAMRGYPVHVTGVLTYYDPYLNYPRRPIVMLTDSTDSIYVALPGLTPLPLQAGARLEVWGQSGAGDFAPTIDRARIRILGQAPLPAHAPAVTFAYVRSGGQDAQWSQMEGIVESVEHSGRNVTIKLVLGDGEIAATTVLEPDADYASLVDARVKIRGIAGTLFNRHGQIIGAQLLFPGMQTVDIVEAAPKQPFALELTHIRDLMKYAPGVFFHHRVHIRGTATLFWPGQRLCVQEGAQALCAGTAETAQVEVGQQMDVAGFPAIGNVVPSLNDAIYQQSASAVEAPPTRPTPIDAEQAMSGEHDAQLVEIEGSLLAHNRAAPDTTLIVSSGKYHFPVVLSASLSPGAMASIEEGSRLRVTGICVLEANAKVFTRHDGYPVAEYFQILLRSPSDIVIVQKPSWWNAEHTLRVLAAALVLTLGALGWVIYLRTRVKKQAELLRHQATHDGLTGIWNRKEILNLLQRESEIAARAHSSVGVMMLDADHFKNVNDTYGHQAGDDVLQELVRRIQQALRSYDLVGRYGGEEFLVVLPGCDEERLLQCAERIRQSVAEQEMEAAGVRLEVTVSIGTAVLDPVRSTQIEAVAAADSALYEAKHGGRNRVVVANSSAVGLPTSQLL
jgi:diguanylate cyclase (GGDEF)-like protein